MKEKAKDTKKFKTSQAAGKKGKKRDKKEKKPQIHINRLIHIYTKAIIQSTNPVFPGPDREKDLFFFISSPLYWKLALPGWVTFGLAALRQRNQ